MRFFMMFMFLVSFHPFNLQAEDIVTDDFLMRESWVKTVKTLLAEIELKDKNLMTKNERKFIEIFESAWADSRYNCFFGGWPSVKSGKFCQNPSRTNSSYDKGACKADELQCQPLLFGNGLCVSFKTQSERNKTFANCEGKFQKEYGGKYDFLKSPSRKESEDLQELSRLAQEICTDRKSGICTKVLEKFPSGMKAIDQGFTKAVSKAAPDTKKAAPAAKVNRTPAHAPDCQDPDHEHEQLAAALTKVVEKSGDDLYDKIKTEFLGSPFCDPSKIVNDPADRPSALLVSKITADLEKTDPFSRKETNENFIKRIASKYKLSDSLVSEVLPLLNSIQGTADQYENRRTLIAKTRIMILQSFVNNYRPDESTNELIKDALISNHIFRENDEGEAECPFVSKEAFAKAMAGREQVMKKFGSSLKNKDQITIVDYSRPSNERRMFVIDLATGKVLHNTWVAHGGGGGNADGVDGLGSSPEMSNQPGSNKSSDGFIIASQKASGKMFGNNVLLRGIDQNNSNLAARAVVLHGWGSPFYQYSTGVEQFNSEKQNYDPPYDVVARVKNADPSSPDRRELEKAWIGISGAATTSKYMNPTEGCLGVPMINVKHLDRKGRDKTQLELLRDDLPGSLIFNYSGPDMKSKFF